MPEIRVADNKACECGAILRGEKNPRTAGSLDTVCTPAHPIGACMVSSEGACAAYYSYAVTARLKFRKTPDPAARQRRKTFQAEKNNDS